MMRKEAKIGFIYDTLLVLNVVVADSYVIH